MKTEKGGSAADTQTDGLSGAETTAGNPEIFIIAFLNKKIFGHLIPPV